MPGSAAGQAIDDLEAGSSERLFFGEANFGVLRAAHGKAALRRVAKLMAQGMKAGAEALVQAH